jgi:hypothetical protein
MNGRRLFLVLAAVMTAAYFGARMAGPDFPGTALAGGASVTDPSGLVAVTTGARGNDGNRLVMVDTNKKLLLIYRLRPNYMRLIAARSYKYDLKLEAVENAPGNGFTFEQTRDLILRSQMTEDDKKSMPRGREMVVTTDADAPDSNRIVLVNPAEKRLLVYTLNGNSIGLTAMRRYDFDEQLEYTESFAPGDGFDYTTIKTQVEKKLKEGAGGGN